MKAWILRRDLPRSSKFTIKMYADNGFSSSGFDSEAIFSSAKQCSLVRRAKSRMKDLVGRGIELFY